MLLFDLTAPREGTVVNFVGGVLNLVFLNKYFPCSKPVLKVLWFDVLDNIVTCGNYKCQSKLLKRPLNSIGTEPFEKLNSHSGVFLLINLMLSVLS